MMKRSISIPKVILLAFIILTILFIMSHNHLFQSSHAQAAIDESRIHYLSVPIVAEDTLSDIAFQYYSDEFGSMEEYISRIKQYNSLTSDAIYAGNHLIVPVYFHSEDIS